MNFAEVMELHRAVTAFCLKNSEDHPKLGVYDIQSKDQGYILCVKPNSTNDRFLNFLKNIAKTRKLELNKFRGYFVIHSFGGWTLREN
jgi:hypothetical protein